MNAWLASVRQAVDELRQVVDTLQRTLSQTPVQVTVEHLQVEHLEFRIDSIDVDDLSGELNIGLTNSLKAGSPRQEQAQMTEPPPPPARSGASVPKILWPRPDAKEAASHDAKTEHESAG